MMLSAYEFLNSDSFEIIISGNDEIVKETIFELNKRFIPNKIVIGLTNENKKNLIELIPYLKDYIQDGNSKLQIYVCKNYVCQLPVDNVKSMFDILEGKLK